jgi:excisionase family DNA binding protein
MLIDRPSAVITGAPAALLSLLLRSPHVRTVVEQLPGWARPYRLEIAAAVDAVHRAGAGWVPVAVERDDAGPVGAVEADFECSVVGAAQLLDLSIRRTQELAAAGMLPGRRVGRQWLLERDAVLLVASARRARSA